MAKAERTGTPPDRREASDRITRDVSAAVRMLPASGQVLLEVLIAEVQRDRSFVLGGLVKERRSLTRDGVPFFYKIPLIGWILGSRSNAVDRTELSIFITPRVIASVEEGTQLSREFENRVQVLKGRIGEAKGMKPEVVKEPAQTPRTE